MKFLLAFSLLSLFLIQPSFAQSPQLVNYQAVARDLSGNPLITTPVNITFEVLQGSSTGTAVYSETHVTSTNQFGLFTAEIGGGTPTFGTFGGILWGSGLYYLRVTVNGDIMPATQLLSVPYALHATTASSGVPGANGHANLADSLAEAPGLNCANGGYLIYMGADDNDDNILQPLERDIQYYICNGLDGSANSNDTSATNELQTLSISNDTIFLTSGGFVVLPASSGGLWNTNAQGLDYTAGNVGIGNSAPAHKLTVSSSDSIIASFNGNNPGASIIGISNTNPGATIGTIFLSGTDTAIIALDPAQKLLGVSNNMNGGHVGISSDSTITSYSRIISHVAQDFVFNNTDTVFNISPSGNIINVNQGTFVTDSLYLNGTNKDSTNWILANDGLGQAKWTNPSALNLGGSLWTQGTGDIFNNTDSIGIGVANPSALLHVSGGGLTQPIALFEKGGFLNAAININHTGSNGSGINFQNGGTTTSSITSSTTNVLTLTSQAVEVGNSPKTGIFNIAGTSSVINPSILVHEPGTGFSRIKHTNSVANKYWIVEAGINASNPLSGYSIGYNNGASTSLPFIVYGDNKVGVNNLATPLSSFHVMDINATGNGIISEGFNQPGLVAISRNNFSNPNRGAIFNGEQIGQIAFPGYHSSGYGSGPQIYARATENFTSTSFGSEIIFNTIMNGTTTHVQALRLLNDGRAEFPVGLLIPIGAGANKVLTSDGFGNASWQNPAGGSPWSISGINVYRVLGNVGVGENISGSNIKFRVFTQDSVGVSVESNSPSYAALDVRNTGGNYSGWFREGNVYVQDSVGIGVSNPAFDLHVAGTTRTRFLKLGNTGSEYDMPFADGSANQVLTTNGLGVASWQTPPASSPWTKTGTSIYQNILTDFVGIGTNSPQANLHVVNNGSAIVAVQTFSNTPTIGGNLSLVRARGTSAIPAGVQSGDRLGKLDFVGMDNAFNLSEAASIRAFADETFGSTAHGSHLEFHTTPIGIGVSNEAMRIDPDGKVGIGTGLPSAKLDVQGNFKLEDGTHGAGKVLTSDASGFASWKENQIAFEAHASSVSLINSGILQFGTEFFDDGANYNNTTGVFTAPVNGIYSFNLSIMAILSLSNGSLNVTLRKNGVDNKEQTAYLTSGQPNNITFVTTMRLAAGDTIDIRVNSAPAGTGIQSTAGTWFSGHLVYAN